MIITENNLRRLIRTCILEAKENEEHNELDGELLVEPDPAPEEDPKKDKDKTSPSLASILTDEGVDEVNTVAAGGVAGRIGPLGDEDRGAYQGQSNRKRKQGITHG